MTKQKRKKFWWWNYNPDPKRKCVRCGERVRMSSIRSGGWCFKCLCRQQDIALLLLGTFFTRQLTDEPLPEVFAFFQSLQSATRDAIVALPPGENRGKLVYAFNIATRLTGEWGQEFLSLEGKPTTKAVLAIQTVFNHAKVVGFLNTLNSLRILAQCVELRTQECIAASLTQQKHPNQVAAEAWEAVAKIGLRDSNFQYPTAKEIKGDKEVTTDGE